MTLQQAYRGGLDGRPGWWLHFSYDEETIARIKRLRTDSRAWDEEGKRWWIRDGVAEEVATWLRGFEVYLRQPSLL